MVLFIQYIKLIYEELSTDFFTLYYVKILFLIYVFLIFQGNDYYKSKIGGIISIRGLILLSLFVFYIGAEVFIRAKPNDMRTIQVNKTPSAIDFSVPIGF